MAIRFCSDSLENCKFNNFLFFTVMLGIFRSKKLRVDNGKPPETPAQTNPISLVQEKLALEITILRKQVADLEQGTGFFNRFLGRLRTRLGLILAWVVLLTGLATPVLQLVARSRQAHLAAINSDLLKFVVDSSVGKTDSARNAEARQIENISLQDPTITAPFFFSRMNERIIPPNEVYKIFLRMYKINKDHTHYTILDRLLFTVFSDNREILEDELETFAYKASRVSSGPDDLQDIEIKHTYIDLIFDLDLEDKKDFESVLNMMANNADTTARRSLQDFIQKRHDAK